MHTLRHAVRTLVRTPAFTAIAVATMALGIAANTAIFSVVNGVLLRPLPFRDEARLVRVWTSTPDEPRGSHSAGEFLDLRERPEPRRAGRLPHRNRVGRARSGRRAAGRGRGGHAGVLRRPWHASGARTRVHTRA